MDAHAPRDTHTAEVRDLGAFAKPVLVCGGAYSNLHALEALFDTARELAIPASRIIHTGDVVAYCADPEAAAELLRASGAHAIPGNVEQSLAAGLDDCQCGFGEGSVCDALAAEWFAYANARIGDELRRWMAGLPDHLEFEMAGRRVRVVHGAPGSVNRYVFASNDQGVFEQEFRQAGTADMIVAGHSGLPFTRELEGRVWHNSGALGMPANDGTPRAWFSVLAPTDKGIAITRHALTYDHAAARARMADAGLCDAYAQSLTSGLWPSLDILPPEERDRTGVALENRESYVWETGERAA